jgi:hypothetical protein
MGFIDDDEAKGEFNMTRSRWKTCACVALAIGSNCSIASRANARSSDFPAFANATLISHQKLGEYFL